MLARPPIKSPCIQVCVVDPATGWCEGCYRSLAEIGGWMRFSDEERDRVMRQLAARRRTARETPPRECAE
ncbi:DUF1289 domain-containing protein [Hansschlegelia zhihuaiae]|uniref:DUF1289 domain-containing protein n=1 Tax=Hansschlegelia zhihuaiae TaxID=405005 RepID=A0A4V1KJU3_9HYPH|nr:DUF1289 domain-containing protein [Hansschlegelia zhihuaiae]RXF75392.1 DUF1289 domain-containing protein [Hansschlegelia zhihuaiae]